MKVQKRKRGFRIGVGALAAAYVVLLAVTSLSGCRIYVTGAAPRNPFLGEWHAEFTSGGTRFSAEYDFGSSGRYTYVRQSASGAVRITVSTKGAYRYDAEMLSLTPDASDVAPSRFRYAFTGDDQMQLEERISPSVTLRLTYHRHP